jgi:large subunit ribosomal protein L5
VKVTPRLLERYRKEVSPALIKEFGYDNPMRVPRLRKVVLNIGLGEALANPKAIESATKDLTTIAGQKAVVTKAKKSIANFKLRQGAPIGVMVTLRGSRMYSLLDRLFNAALPRIRDFRGVSRTAFDGRGNYTLGLREQMVFPDIAYGDMEKLRGLQITISTNARNDKEAMRFLELMGMPFARTVA